MAVQSSASGGKSVASRDDLVGWIAGGETAKPDWRIGTEHEKFLFDRKSFRRPSYGDANGVGPLLERLLEELGGEAYMEGGNIIGIREKNGGSLTLEPGGQFELSGAPLETIHDTCSEATTHLEVMQKITEEMGLGMLGVGYDPMWRRDDIPWMPKGRYSIMRNHMPKVGKLGLDMMLRTCTIQVNLDYSDERDMVRKFRTSLALQPVATAIFANSPFREGQPSGLLSTRAEAWTDTDPARCGVPACVFEDGFGYEQWVDYILDVPMYFLHRGDDYLDVAGLSFRDFMQGKLPGHEGELPRFADWEDHITTAFPEVRLKTFLEMRGADGGPWNMICALPALWVGLLYDDDALDAAEDLARGLTARDVAEARLEAAQHGFKGRIGKHDIGTVAEEMVNIAARGLQSRARLDKVGDDEQYHLNPIREIVGSRRTRSADLLDLFHGDWSGDMTRLYHDFQY
jgi:glutamate--cysteine ligase